MTTSNNTVNFTYDTHYTEGERVSFKKQGLNIAGLLFFPDNFNAENQYPAIVVSHPGGGVKEQASSLYAYHLAKAGYVALAFDASHQGESEGLPRYLEDPTSRVEDIRSAVDYLVTLPYVDEEKIGAMGICAGAGYTLSAIQTEYRIKAAAGVSSWNTGHSARHGNPGLDDPNNMQNVLTQVAQQRTREARGEEPLIIGYVPETEEEFQKNYYGKSVIMKEAYEYYKTPRCAYPTSVNKVLFTSLDKLAAFDAFSHLDTVSPRPLLFIVGSGADTIYFSEMAYEKAQEPKELFRIPGSTHIDLYDKTEYVSQAVDKLVDFFNQAI
ncbi:alpha/beta hydrolase [Vibrio mangrovi]|uniref:Alpha/beta hydrolase n=1 Tax=Vibrio mangrovi TaxID=474394 RepID=A0A1Y6IZT3_9VIBR|nr:alpha/beta hydrolase [Vibrio mangrovi]MDW6002469.1 alpha/beta hydrolase [Vibrio mangrovi]SMS02002.1 Alpha/beta hydrolase family protein [Vibrio mangrovi]